MIFRSIDKKMASDVVVREHYLHRKPPISYAFGMFEGDDVVGVLTIGSPASHELRKGACPENPLLVYELNRLWVDDSMPKNSETQFVAAALKKMPPFIIVSYADTAFGHVGYVYRAGNWNYAGWTDMDRKTPRFDYIPVAGGHSRNAFRGGYIEKVRRQPKHKYWITTGNHSERRVLAKMCGWPRMPWK